MTRIYFVRHAEPEHGWKDNRTRPLSAEGREDCRIVTEFFADRQIDFFYSSPYRRSMDTIAGAAAAKGKEILTEERFRERDCLYGSNDLGSIERRWRELTWREEGGESIAMVQKRNIEALRELLEAHRDSSLVIGTHGTALSSILNYYNPGFGFRDFQRILDWMPYILELDFEGDQPVRMEEHCRVEKVFRGTTR